MFAKGLRSFVLSYPILRNPIRTIMSTPSKVAKPISYIGTHDNTFHCDDVTACYMLKSLERFRDHEIVRTRDPTTLAGAEIVVDVGGECDIAKLRLDHHQRSFNQTIKDYHPTIRATNPDKPPRLSSAGLVFAVFGKDYIIQQLKLGKHYADLEADQQKMIDAIFERAYLEFMEEIDAVDNGVEVASGDNLVFNYHIKSGISNRVARYNPRAANATPEERLEQFKKAMQMVGAEISEGIKYLNDEWWPRRQQIRKAVMKRTEFDPSGQIVCLDKEQVPGWKSAFIELEEELDIVGQLKFLIYYDGTDTSPWRTLAVPVTGKAFESRVPLKEEWRGKRDEELQKDSGIPDATFVHMSGFTGGAKSVEGIKKLVRITLGLE